MTGNLKTIFLASSENDVLDDVLICVLYCLSTWDRLATSGWLGFAYHRNQSGGGQRGSEVLPIIELKNRIISRVVKGTAGSFYNVCSRSASKRSTHSLWA